MILTTIITILYLIAFLSILVDVVVYIRMGETWHTGVGRAFDRFFWFMLCASAFLTIVAEIRG